MALAVALFAISAVSLGLAAARWTFTERGACAPPEPVGMPPPRALALRGRIAVDVTFGAPGTRCFAPAEGAEALYFIFDRGALRRANDRPGALAWLASAREMAGELLDRYRFGVTHGVAWLKTRGPYERRDASVAAALADGGTTVAAAWRALALELRATTDQLPAIWCTERPLRLEGTHRGRCFTLETIRLGRDTETRVSVDGAQHFLPDVVPNAATVLRIIEELAAAAPATTPYR